MFSQVRSTSIAPPTVGVSHLQGRTTVSNGYCISALFPKGNRRALPRMFQLWVILQPLHVHNGILLFMNDVSGFSFALMGFLYFRLQEY